MSASAKRRRRIINKRAHQLVNVRGGTPEPPGPAPAPATTAPPRTGRVGGCSVCSISSFASPADALEHGRSAGHLEKSAEAKQRRQQEQSALTRQAASFEPEAQHLKRPVPAAVRRGPKVQEGRQWELYNSDGSLNLASYSYGAVVGFVELAHDLVSRRVADIQGETGTPAEMGFEQVQALAAWLLKAADRTQAATRMDGRVDRMDASHTRARGAVRTALRVYPVPWGATQEARGEWLENLASHAAALMRIAFDIFRGHETGDES